MFEYDPAIYRAAHQRIVSGLWVVDAEQGFIYGTWRPKPHQQQGRPLGCQRSPGGYVVLTIRVEGRKRNALAHRIIWEHVHGPSPAGMQVNHRDGVKSNNRISNLELVTNSGNRRHAFATGLQPVGSALVHAKLTEADIPKIRDLLAQGVTKAHLAKAYGVSRKAIRQVAQGKSWAHVK